MLLFNDWLKSVNSLFNRVNDPRDDGDSLLTRRFTRMERAGYPYMGKKKQLSMII